MKTLKTYSQPYWGDTYRVQGDSKRVSYQIKIERTNVWQERATESRENFDLRRIDGPQDIAFTINVLCEQD